MSERLDAGDAELLASVRDGEGLRLRSYPDPLSGASPYTIGWGHTGPEVGPNTTCTLPQALSWLETDLANAIWALDDRLPWWRELPLEAQRVLAEMTFNLGIGGLLGFHHFLNDLSAHRFGAAAVDMMLSAWARQIGDRAKRLSDRIAALGAAQYGADLTAKALEA